MMRAERCRACGKIHCLCPGGEGKRVADETCLRSVLQDDADRLVRRRNSPPPDVRPWPLRAFARLRRWMVRVEARWQRRRTFGS